MEKSNDTSLRYYSFFVHINPFVQRHEWGSIETRVQDYYLDFLNGNEYGDLISTTFNFFVENEIDIDKQDDYIGTSSYMGIPPVARLSVHVDYEYFCSNSDELKFKILINGILYLLKYWNTHLKIPKDMCLEQLTADYKHKLEENLLYMEDIGNKVIKIVNPFRFSFILHMCPGINEHKLILFDTDKIEQYLNNNLYYYDFGKSVNHVFFSYDILDFSNEEHKDFMNEEDTKYRYGRDKSLIIVEQFDSRLFDKKTKQEQVAYLHKGMSESINRIKKMKRKPKDFDIDKFLEVIEKLMCEYEKSLE